MIIVLLCALGVGGATMLGALLGFVFKGLTHRHSDAVLAFAAGVSLASSVIGLILPSLEYGGDFGVIITVLGIFAGALAVTLLGKLLPAAHKFVGSGGGGATDFRTGRVLLFVMAIAMHNLPEGIAAGVGFGGDDVSGGILIALGIAIQNLPEGMVIIAPMLSLGISKKRTLITALLTGVVEVVGTFIGYFAVSLAEAILPFSLAFAGGTMLFVVGNDMIPETHSDGNADASTYSMLAGFSLMVILNVFL